MSTDQDAQNDEMLALESIYDTDEFSFTNDNGEFSGQFKAFVSLPGEIKIEYQLEARPNKPQAQQNNPNDVNHLTVKFLPPIEFLFTLPSDYPSTSPPKFTLVCVWLGRKQISLLCKKLDSLWEENKGMEILFTWLSFLKEDTFSFLKLASTIDLSKQYTYNMVQLERKKKQLKNVENSDPVPDHENTTVLTNTAGCSSTQTSGSSLNTFTKCHRGRGGERGRGRAKYALKDPSDHSHPGCNEENIRRYSRNPFSSKARSRVQLDSRAVSCESLQSSLISHLVECNREQSEKEFHRNIFSCAICFEDKPGSQCIEFNPCGHIFCQECIGNYFEVNIKDGNVHGLICPEKGCKSEALQSQICKLVSPELFARYDGLLLSSTLDEMEDIVYCPRKSCQYPVTYEKGERMGQCAVCMYTFCTLCRMGFHGINPCNLKLDSGLIAEYLSGSDSQKAQLEKKYGRKTIQNLLETEYSEAWIRGNSQKCPHCQTAIEKSDGCNKMVCWKCNTIFCWLCNTRLNPTNPYSHFNSSTSRCFNLLFHGINNESDEDEVDEDEVDDDLEFLLQLI